MKKQKHLAFLGILIVSGMFFASDTFAVKKDYAQVKAIKDEKLEMSLSSNNINVVLDDDSLKTKNLTISVSTNNPNGYTVSLGPKEGYTELRNKRASRNENVTIPTLTEDKTEREFNETAWGYNVAGYFTGLKSDSENIFKTKEEGSRDHIMTIGVRAKGNDIIAGTYENDLLVSAVGNYVRDDDDNFRYVVCEPLANSIEDDGLSTTYVAQCLQDINEEVIETMEMEKEYWLHDSRDGKRYSVIKIYNGRVWMTKNLDLVLDENMTLTDKSTDLNTKEEWTPNHSTKNRLDRNFNALVDTFNPGDFYFDRSLYDSFDTIEDYDETTCREKYNYGDCYKYIAPEGLEQYKVGTYYTYSAAIAKNGEPEFEIAQNATMKDSICPKGWKLPNKYEYEDLVAAVADRYDKLLRAPYYMPYLDAIQTGKVDDHTDGSHHGDRLYWTSTYSRETRTYEGTNEQGEYGVWNFDRKTLEIFNTSYVEELRLDDNEEYSLNIAAPIRCVSR